jgi:hypothetical protein
MGVPPSARARGESPPSDDGEPSVTAVGEPVLVRAAAPEIVRGAVLAGRYQVEASLGKGGSGIVLRAFDRVAQLPVALKLLKPDLAADPRWIDRFSRELRLARQIQHPHVCRVFDIGQADGHWFITMELASPETLREQIKPRGKGRSLEQRLADLRAVVGGLEAIHDAGIVHRDLKPDNFLRMGDGRLVLSDFGLATNPAEGSVVSILVGTPSYMAPEVVIGEQASFASDVWSLGVVMHEILFGQRPEWAPGTYRRVSLPARGPLALEEKAIAVLIEECIQPEPGARPANGREVRLRFEAALAGRLVRTRWLSRRRRGQWAWLAVAAATACAAALSSGHLWRRASAISEAPTSSLAPTKVRGDAVDLSKTMKVVASFHGTVHCLSWLVPDRTLRVVVGTPRRALVLDVESGMAKAADLPEATFAIGCPQRSAQGDLLYERLDDSGRHEIVLATAEGGDAKAKAMTTGSEPVWLPSGREFVYTADDTHAAVFSIPVMTTSILPGATEGGMLVEKVVAPDGRLLALRYIDGGFRRRVVLHDLPSLAIHESTLFDESAIDLTFGSNDDLLFTIASARGRLLAGLDRRSGVAVRLGGVPGRDLRLPQPGNERLAVVSTLLESDVWRHDGAKRTARLTTDGRSYYPDLSSRGDLVVQHDDLALTYSIWLIPAGGPARAVTSGPQDWTPRFLPDGSGWLYVDGSRKMIRKCSLDGACEDVLGTEETPFFPVASPDQGHVAFITVLGRNRLKVSDGRGAIRDLGPARPNCSPHWSSPTRVWALQGTDQAPAWTEYDVTTGAQVRTSTVTEPPRTEIGKCPFLTAPPGVTDAPRIAAWSAVSAEIGVLPVQQPGWGKGQNP